MKEVVLLKSNPKHKGGFEKVAGRISDEFRKRGENVIILSPTYAWPKFRSVAKFDKTVKTYLKEHKVDIVFGMDRNREQTHFRAGNGCHRSFLESRIVSEGSLKYYSCLLNPMHRKILSNEKLAFESATLKKLFVNSHMVEREILTHYAVDPKKICVVHNGVEWHEMQSNFDTWQEHKNSNEFTFLFIGNGYLRKGLKQLLHALALFKKPPKLLVVGKESQMEIYQQLAEKLDLPVQFCGPVSDVRPYYQAADALVIPSYYDPFANVTVEALAMGLFVVSSKSNGGSEILTAQTGEIIEDLRSIDSLYHSLKIAMEKPKTTIRAELIRSAVKYLDYSNQLTTLVDGCYG